jgi:hypothetical protein
MLEITANKMSGVTFYINNGTSPTKAANETTVSTYSSTSYKLNPNMTYYLVVVATDTSPVLNFTYRYYAVVPSCGDNQETLYNETAIRWYCKDVAPIYINITKNITVWKIVELDGPTKPLYGSIVIMFVITGGVITFLLLGAFIERRKRK